MGNTVNQSTNQSTRAEQIAHIGGISREMFNYLQTHFASASGGNMKLNYNDFLRLYSNVTGISSLDYNNQLMAERVFKAIDLDNNQYITFDEFILAYMLLEHKGEPLYSKIQKFLACYFVGYIPDYINPSDSFKIQQSLNILCGVPVSSQPMHQTGYMGQMSHMGQGQMMGHGMTGHGMTGQGLHSAGVLGSAMRHSPYSGGHQQMSGLPRDQFIQSIIGNPGYASFLSTSSLYPQEISSFSQMDQYPHFNQHMGEIPGNNCIPTIFGNRWFY